MNVSVKTVQRLLKKFGFDPGPIDGVMGKRTRQALQDAMDGRELVGRDTDPKTSPNPVTGNRWPRQAKVRQYYGEVGKNQTILKLPYPMKLAWNKSRTVMRFSCHEKVHDSLERIFQKTLDHYGEDEIRRLRLDLFGGCLNVRKMRGGSRYSMHSWGIAVDLDPERNRLRWDHKRAAFAGNEYKAFWKIVEGEGWVSLGRTRDYDWMHFQAARL